MTSYKLLDPEAIFRNVEGSEGYDLKITSIIPKYELSHNLIFVGTGVKLNMPPNLYAHLYARSSMPSHGFGLANGVGIIDNNYQGEIKATLIKYDNCTDLEELKKRLIGKSLLQIVFFERVQTLVLRTDEEFVATSRGENGFGSTDVAKPSHAL